MFSPLFRSEKCIRDLLALWGLSTDRNVWFPYPLTFHIPEAWKRYLFRVEPHRIGHYREYPPTLDYDSLKVLLNEDLTCDF